MKSMKVGIVAGGCAVGAFSFAGAADWTVSVDPSVELGPIKPVNAVNCGPRGMAMNVGADEIPPNILLTPQQSANKGLREGCLYGRMRKKISL